MLILGICKATKSLGQLVGLDKTYEATLHLGAVSDTYDRTGKITESNINCQVSNVPSVLKQFTGTLQQIPPMYSAKKVGGKKLYELARQGIEIERKPMKVTIYELYTLPLTSSHEGREDLVSIYVHCSSGTYIRSLAHDIGQTLGCGAYLEELRRTAIGQFRVEKAIALAELTIENIASRIHVQLSLPNKSE